MICSVGYTPKTFEKLENHSFFFSTEQLKRPFMNFIKHLCCLFLHRSKIQIPSTFLFLCLSAHMTVKKLEKVKEIVNKCLKL